MFHGFTGNGLVVCKLEGIEVANQIDVSSLILFLFSNHDPNPNDFLHINYD